MDDFIGQDKVKERLGIFLQAAKLRDEPIDHILLHGPPGLGKTTLAEIVANEMGVNFHVTSGPAIERPSDLASILTNLAYGDVLFIDEIHRIHRSVEEVLYPAMEDYALDIIVGKGPSARSVRIELERFTLVGATTRAGQLSAPLRDRFGVVLNMDMYDDSSLEKIVDRSANILQVQIIGSGAMEIAKRSRGTPRIANRLLKRVRDYAQVIHQGTISESVADEALEILEVDPLGLDEMDRKIIRVIIENFKGGPVGIDTIAASVGEETVTIEDVYEPFLLRLGFISRTPRGRVLTKKAYDHLGYEWREDEN